MVQATTPTFVLSLPEDIDLSQASAVFFSLRQYPVVLKKTGDELTIEGNVVSVPLTQAETLSLHGGDAFIQLNWTYSGGRRAASNVAKVKILPNLLQEVIE